MKKRPVPAPTRRELVALWGRHGAEWRDPAQVASQWQEAATFDHGLLRHVASGDWWGVLEATGATLMITREYEHLVVAMCVEDGKPMVSFMRLPHPSGVAVDAARGIVHIAATRNPNQVFDFAPAVGMQERLDMSDQPAQLLNRRPLVPVRARFLPGCLYLHDLALIGGRLHGNSVGQNAIVRLEDTGEVERVWWPRCIETTAGPVFGRNHLQLNSIAAGSNLEGSFFSASSEAIGRRRPGHLDYPVKGLGVIFSGATREPVVRGLTRPHSARLHLGRVWVDNSGYGEVGFSDGGKFVAVSRLAGWTRGLTFKGQIAFVGTSRVIPRFERYAPGLVADRSACGIHALDTLSGATLGSLTWPLGNQVFAIELIPRRMTSGFPFRVSRRARNEEKRLFYGFRVH